MAFNRLTNIILILIVHTYISLVACEESDEVYYVAQFNDKITECEDFENKVCVCENVEVGFVAGSEGSDGGYRLFGQLNLKEAIQDDWLIDIMIYKDNPAGKEFMYSIGGNICDSLKEQDTPWDPLIEMFNSTDCPIPPGIFDLNNLNLSLNFAKDVLRHELCGDYLIELAFQTGLKQQLSCYNVPVEVIEKTN